MHKALRIEDKRLLEAFQHIRDVYQSWCEAYYGLSANLNDIVHHIGDENIDAFVDLQGVSTEQARESIKGIVERALELVEEKPHLPAAAHSRFAPLVREGVFVARKPESPQAGGSHEEEANN